MISNHEYCSDHPNFQIGGIYIGNEKQNFSRKVCVECILSHKIPHEKLLSKKEILQQLLYKSNQLNMNNVLDQSQCILLFKPFLNQLDLIEKQICLIFKSKRDSIKRISDDLASEDNKFLNLIKKDFNPFESSLKELDFLVNFLECNIFEEQINRKKMVTSVIQKAGLFLEELIQYVFKASHLIGEIHTQFTTKKKEESIIQLEGLQQFKNQLVKTPFHLITQINGNKVYKKDGQILRIEKYILGQKNEKILLNLEQMKYLEFKGQYGINGYKFKQWNYYWRGNLIGGGNFNIMGQKEGKWFDLCDNYWDKMNIIEEGYYQEDKRFGNWKINWNNQTIGGGSYDNQGIDQKIGRWVELSEGYCDEFQVTYRGDYKDGKKFGRWEIWYNNGKGDQEIGGGLYDEGVGSVKVGKWIDISDGFCRDCQVTYNGEYKNGKRVGRWDIWFKENAYNQENTKIGGGQYDKGGDGMKTGKWIEICVGFYDDKQVTYNGEYKNGKRVGRWDIWFKENGFNKQNIKIGGGQYDEGSESTKTGKWIEISDGFKFDSQVTYKGNYQNGKKYGRWDIWYHNAKGDQKMQKIKYQVENLISSGGGLYDEGVGSVKVGKWIDISEEFQRDCQVTYKGEYKNGKRVGRWDIWYQDIVGYNEQIGGGSYDEEGDDMKNGKWIDLDERFCFSKQVIHNGYYKNGKKIGQWIETDIETNKQLGEKKYDN